MNITEKIREIRQKQGLKQFEVADKLGVEQSNYSYLEKRDKKLTIEQLEQIAEVLGTTVKEILFSEKSTESEKEFEYLKREFEYLKKEMDLKNKIIEIQEENVKVKEASIGTLLLRVYLAMEHIKNVEYDNDFVATGVTDSIKKLQSILDDHNYKEPPF